VEDIALSNFFLLEFFLIVHLLFPWMLDVIRAALSRRIGTQEKISAIFKIKFAAANEQDCA
jgi:hypothetical protein